MSILFVALCICAMTVKFATQQVADYMLDHLISMIILQEDEGKRLMCKVFLRFVATLVHCVT